MAENLYLISDKQAKNTQFQEKYPKSINRFKNHTVCDSAPILRVDLPQEVVLLNHSNSNREDNKAYLVFYLY